MSRAFISSLRPGLAPRTVIAPLSLRHASSFSSPLEPSTSHTQPSHSLPTGSLPLSWPKYLTLRRQQRLWHSVTTVPTTLAGLFLGGGYFASLEADPTQLIFGIEPMFVYGGATMACMGLGYLLGPTVGSGLFSITHPSLARGNPAPLEVMDREFYHRIKKNRADPRFQSVQNIVPDFYGEKVICLSRIAGGERRGDGPGAEEGMRNRR
ncbi:presequence translocated-associated motor subunit PAM17, mitochondrial, variant [Cryptococcus amylolentus CBS 6039]|uniref:Presequence translocated-associated motor subunit PAM17 n=1 Tax=Cryptococcus amylolentus CBS 6039 TaxID=1295533 RepID=A0A1E3H999_9TREE|nr:presequence translocated-associated motor subunit PAM17, mitochondrial, variant [Cryptococcus amylolentus CBS 6039]ODN72864.1 presequence translocated-associated motor subunit PAM17, mitochondrial, variant [Cryptococcus amylolentus CBS 6039]